MADKTVDLTEVVEKVAKFQYTRHAENSDTEVTWEMLDPMSKYYLKEVVTPLVVATLDAAGVSHG